MPLTGANPTYLQVFQVSMVVCLPYIHEVLVFDQFSVIIVLALLLVEREHGEPDPKYSLTIK